MNNKYPTVVKVVSESTEVEVNMENVVHVEPNYQKIPLVIRLVPHDGRIYLHFSSIAGNQIEIEEQSANGCYISFEKNAINTNFVETILCYTILDRNNEVIKTIHSNQVRDINEVYKVAQEYAINHNYKLPITIRVAKIVNEDIRQIS